MTPFTLTLYRPWHERLADAVRDWRLRPRRRGRAALEPLHGLGRHLLDDIGVDAGLAEALDAEAQRHARGRPWLAGGVF